MKNITEKKPKTLRAKLNGSKKWIAISSSTLVLAGIAWGTLRQKVSQHAKKLDDHNGQHTQAMQERRKIERDLTEFNVLLKETRDNVKEMRSDIKTLLRQRSITSPIP